VKSLSLILAAFLPAAAGGAAAAPPVAAPGPVRIYIANDDHTDLLWTADEEAYGRAFVGMLDFHLKLADDTAANPPPYRNRFNCDGSFWLWNYERRKSPAEFARLIARIKDGTISAPLNLVVPCYGGQPVEAVLRGMYYAGRLERQHGLRFPLAIAMENQTLPRGLASLFAGSGARYSWRGVCACGTMIDKHALQARPREIGWWTGPDGQRVLLKWHSLTPGEAAQNSGGYAEAFDPVVSVDYLDQDPVFLRRIARRAQPSRIRSAAPSALARMPWTARRASLTPGPSGIPTRWSSTSISSQRK
jgi:alpha-mannosidase